MFIDCDNQLKQYTNTAICKDRSAHLLSAGNPRRGFSSNQATEIEYSAPQVSESCTEKLSLQNLQDAIYRAAKERKHLFLRKQDFVLNATIKLPSYAIVDFGGSTFTRHEGKEVFDLFTNSEPLTGNTSIHLSNLLIDGAKDRDQLDAVNPSHRFGGISFTRVADSSVSNVTVTGTVNNEGTAGVYLKACRDIRLKHITAYRNDRSAILIDSSRATVQNALLYDNKGSGITSRTADDCKYFDITAGHNGYSNISINGKRCSASHIVSYNAGFSGINIGHPNSPADDTVISNAHSFENAYEGITVSFSKNVKILNCDTHSNKRNNIRIFQGSTESKIDNLRAYNSSGGQGVLYESGFGHVISMSKVFNNAASGLYISSSDSMSVMANKIYNNGQSLSIKTGGIILNNTINSRIIGNKIYDDQPIATQETGIWIASGKSIIIAFNHLIGNRIFQFRETNNPVGVKYTENKAIGRDMNHPNMPQQINR